MFSLLRSLLFLTMSVMLFVIAPVAADELVAPRQRTAAHTPPPLPRPQSDTSKLEGLRAAMSGSRTAHPNIHTVGTAQPTQSMQIVRQEVQTLMENQPPNSVGQASFGTHAPSFSMSVTPEEYHNEEPPDDFYTDDYVENAPNKVLDKFLSSTKQAEATEEEEESQEGGWKNKLTKQELTPVLSVAGSLLIVVAAFFILAILFRKVAPQGNRPLPKEAFESLGRYYLTQKHQLQVLRVGNRIVLVSIMSDGVSTLAEITDPDEVVSFLGLCRRLDNHSATEMFRKTVASMSEDELSRPHDRPVVARQKGRHSSSLDLYSDPDESLASILARGRSR